MAMFYARDWRDCVREIGLVKDGVIYSYTSWGNSGMGSLRWPWWDGVPAFLRQARARGFRFFEHRRGEYAEVSARRRAQWLALIRLGDYESRKYREALTIYHAKEELRQWKARERKQLTEARASLRALKKYLKQRNSLTQESTPGPISLV